MSVEVALQRIQSMKFQLRGMEARLQAGLAREDGHVSKAERLRISQDLAAVALDAEKAMDDLAEEAD